MHYLCGAFLCFVGENGENKGRVCVLLDKQVKKMYSFMVSCYIVLGVYPNHYIAAYTEK